MHKLISAVYIMKLSKYLHILFNGYDPYAFIVKYAKNKEFASYGGALKERINKLKL